MTDLTATHKAGKSACDWLVEAARRAKVPGSETLRIPSEATVAEAWDLTCKICGLKPEELAAHVARSLSIEVADMKSVTGQAIALLPEKLARQRRVVPLRQDDRQFLVATANPLDHDAEQEIRFATGRSTQFLVAPPDAIQDAIDEHYHPTTGEIVRDYSGNLEEALKEVQGLDPEVDALDEVASAPVVRLTGILLRDAVKSRASDLHLEPGPHEGAARIRVDGLMRVHTTLPTSALTRVLARIKIMGGLDIADRLRPQDGHARVMIDGQSMDLRISTVPTRDAEKAVVRFLGRSGPQRLEEIEMLPEDVEAVRSLIGHRDGMVVVTGPTGSGKTTTLYAMVRELARTDINVMTVEDPIEYELQGITQIQVEPKRQVTFPSALRAILRQDPDMILVGEIRDTETANVALQAAITGHLVLTTLHTNDAPTAVRRLLDLGADPATISAAMRGVIAQRLVRRVCPECSLPVRGELDDHEARLAEKYGIAPTVRTRGCPRCGMSGYRERVPVLEILRMTPELTELLARGAETPDIRRAALAGGMRILAKSGVARVAAGQTTLDELDRVIGPPSEAGAPAGASPASVPAGRGKGSFEAQLEGGLSGSTPETRPVLVVDDDPIHRTVSSHALSQQGFQVVEAASGTEALERVSAGEPFALVLLDLRMPGLGGREVVSCLRAMPKTARLPIIVATSAADEKLEVELMEAGADDYIRKPIDPGRLVARVRGALRRAAA